jgi:hypothetical protein
MACDLTTWPACVNCDKPDYLCPDGWCYTCCDAAYAADPAQHAHADLGWS